VADYEMFGHRDGRLNTSCPGDQLYAFIHGWPHYSTRHIHKYATASQRNSSGSNSVATGSRRLTRQMLVRVLTSLHGRRLNNYEHRSHRDNEMNSAIQQL